MHTFQRTAVIRTRDVIAGHPVALRCLLAGPGALGAALLFVMAMPVWLPAGAAGVDHVVWPMVLAPLVWAIICTYACLEEDLLRCIAVISGVVLVSGVLSGLAMVGWV